jgi:four helix bundle protein
MKNFKELKIWKKGMEIIQVTYTIIDLMPKGLRYELGSQMIRSAISIPSNIAEGSSRTSSKDYNRFLEIASMVLILTN